VSVAAEVRNGRRFLELRSAFLRSVRGAEKSRVAFHVEHSSSSPALLRVLRDGVEELSLDAELALPLARLCDLLAHWSARMNLTGHRTPVAIARRLVLDARALGAVLPVATPASVADLGSGAGFPGLPLAILWPHCQVTLVEARERRHHFQRAAIRTLGLANVSPRRARIEEIDAEPHEVVVAQALAQADRALEWMLPWVAPGGWIVLPRSVGAPALEAPLCLEDARTHSYVVPLGGAARTVWIARRRLVAPPAAVVGTERPPR
jgi:16S rRNA (guanine(527)-N(7))-methyltransferase RsmG